MNGKVTGITEITKGKFSQCSGREPSGNTDFFGFRQGNFLQFFFSFARVPMDIWVDAFRPLPRPELDAAQFSNSAFAHAMQSPAVPAREVECISIQPLWNHNKPAIDPRKVMEQHMMETRAHHALYRLRQLQQQQRGVSSHLNQ